MPICRALSAQGLAIAPRTYWARRKRPPSARALRDAVVTRLLASVFEPGKNGRPAPESLYGAVKAWGWLRRQGVSAARCTVERIMRANGWRGNVRQARKIRTTVANPAAERFPDLVRRQFKAEAPGRLLVADFTYLALAGGGFAYVAFVIDAYAGTIRGWECSLSKTARFIQRGDPPGHHPAGPARPPCHGRRHPPFRRRLAIHQCPVHRDPDARGAGRIDRYRRGRLR